MKPAPWNIPASDPLDGGRDHWLAVVKGMLAVGQTWAVPENYTRHTRETWLTFEITQLEGEYAFGILRSYDLNGIRWDRAHFLYFGFFAGHMLDQDRRPVLIDGPLHSPEMDDTTARARVMEV